MLVLRRKPGEKLILGKDITLTVLGVKGRWVRLGVEAPGHIGVLRAELALPAEQKRPARSRSEKKQF